MNARGHAQELRERSTRAEEELEQWGRGSHRGWFDSRDVLRVASKEPRQ